MPSKVFKLSIETSFDKFNEPVEFVAPVELVELVEELDVVFGVAVVDLAALVELTPKDERTEFNFAPQPPDVDCLAILGCTC